MRKNMINEKYRKWEESNIHLVNLIHFEISKSSSEWWMECGNAGIYENLVKMSIINV